MKVMDAKNTAALVKILTDADVDKKDATSKVTELVARVEKDMAKDSEDARVLVCRMKLYELVRGPAVERFVGVLLGFSERRDSNDYAKRQALDAYKADATNAVNEGLVAVNHPPGGAVEVVPLDSRKFLDKAKTIQNRNYGRPLGVQMRREMIFSVEGALTSAFGDPDGTLNIGGSYEFYGNKADKGYINLAKKPAPKQLAVTKPADLWKIAFESANNSPMSIALEEVPATEIKFIATTGYVRYVGETQRGPMLVIETDETPDGLVCLSTGDEVGKTFGTMDPGNEVIVLGRVYKSTAPDGSPRTSLFTVGIVRNPATVRYAEALSKLDDIHL